MYIYIVVKILRAHLTFSFKHKTNKKYKKKYKFRTFIFKWM